MMKTTSNPSLAELKIEAEVAEGIARALRRQYNDALKEAAPWHVDDEGLQIVGYGERRAVKRFKIVASKVAWDGIEYSVRYQNKDGSWSKNTTRIHHWSSKLRPLDYDFSGEL
jgi:hypothetical protein